MYRVFFAESVFWSVKSVIFIRYIRDAHHFKAEALPKVQLRFSSPNTLGVIDIKMMNSLKMRLQ